MRRSTEPAMWRKWKPTGASPCGRSQICASVSPAVQFSRSSRACSKEYRSGASSGCTSGIGPRSQGSGFSAAMLMASVIPRHGRIDLQAPSIDPARHALAGADSLFAKPVHHLKAANAMMAEHDERGVVRAPLYVLELRRHAAHRDQLRAFDVRLLKLARLAEVDKYDLLAGIAAPADLLRRNFKFHP